MDYANQIASAKKLIAKYGGPARLVVTTTVEGTDEWSPAQDSEQSEEVTVVFLNYSRLSMFAQMYEAGETVQRGDKRVLLAAQGLTLVPNLQGRIERVNGSVTEAWKIVGIDPLNIDEQHPILYALQVRQ